MSQMLDHGSAEVCWQRKKVSKHQQEERRLAMVGEASFMVGC